MDIVERLRFDAVRCEIQFSKGVAGNIEEAADEIERLRKALEPFAEYYDLLECNNYLDGFDLICRQHGNILGHADVQLSQLKGARDALAAPSQRGEG